MVRVQLLSLSFLFLFHRESHLLPCTPAWEHEGGGGGTYRQPPPILLLLPIFLPAVERVKRNEGLTPSFPHSHRKPREMIMFHKGTEHAPISLVERLLDYCHWSIQVLPRFFRKCQPRALHESVNSNCHRTLVFHQRIEFPHMKPFSLNTRNTEVWHSEGNNVNSKTVSSTFKNQDLNTESQIFKPWRNWASEAFYKQQITFIIVIRRKTTYFPKLSHLNNVKKDEQRKHSI